MYLVTMITNTQNNVECRKISMGEPNCIDQSSGFCQLCRHMKVCPYIHANDF